MELKIFRYIIQNFQVVILSDTFYEIASPLFNKLGNPTVFCHHLDVSKTGDIKVIA